MQFFKEQFCLCSVHTALTSAVRPSYYKDRKLYRRYLHKSAPNFVELARLSWCAAPQGLLSEPVAGLEREQVLSSVLEAAKWPTSEITGLVSSCFSCS